MEPKMKPLASIGREQGERESGLLTVWTEFYAPLGGSGRSATADGGWLKAITEAYDSSRAYMEANVPVWDEEVGGWRESTTLGNYLDYGPCRPWAADGEPLVHAVCYVSHAAMYHQDVPTAKAWIESESLRIRPELRIQGSLFRAPSPDSGVSNG